MKNTHIILFFLSAPLTPFAINAGETQVSLGLGVSDYRFSDSHGVSPLDDNAFGGSLQLTHYPYSRGAFNGEIFVGAGFGYVNYGTYDGKVITQEPEADVAERFSIPGEGPFVFLSSKYQTEAWFGKLDIGLMDWSNDIEVNNIVFKEDGTSVIYDVEVGYRASENVGLSIGLNTSSNNSNHAMLYYGKITYSFPN
tara:strand:- start:2007 stop:2594 length:588 start_codon:yes stop_codon:yes gene_type:complete